MKTLNDYVFILIGILPIWIILDILFIIGLIANIGNLFFGLIYFVLLIISFYITSISIIINIEIYKTCMR